MPTRLLGNICSQWRVKEEHTDDQDNPDGEKRHPGR